MDVRKWRTLPGSFLLRLSGAPQAYVLQTIKATQAIASFSFLPADYAQGPLRAPQGSTNRDAAALVSGNVNFNFAARCLTIDHAARHLASGG
jgi:hypothetical protein